ncbi:protein kinase [Microbulbifer taiwanensis]
MTTPSGWKVIEQLNNTLGSGGNFCCRYIAESKNGQIGFLKAMDLTRVVGRGLEAIHRLVGEYLFEKEILFYCKDKKMTKVVTPLDAGELKVPNFSPPLDQVYYVIFECAEGDLRQQHLESSTKSWLAAFSALHQVAIGVHQLHKAGIAHQDIKPSNILCFEESLSKVSDLGRVTDKNAKSPFSGMEFTGDRSYAPIELHFGVQSPEFSDRFYSDIYMVGSLAFHLVSGAQITPFILQESQSMVPNIRTMSYVDALPFLTTSFAAVLGHFRAECTKFFGGKISDQLVTIFFEMCHPDRDKRGSPKHTLKLARLSMSRYVGLFSTVLRTAHMQRVP